MASGQVSVEAISAVVILIFFMVAVLFTSDYMGSQVSFLKKGCVQGGDCAKLVSALELVKTVPGNAQIETNIGSDANVYGNTISFGEQFCYFRGENISVQILAGNVRVSKVSGVVSIENV